MGYAHYGRGYSYASPDPEILEDADVDELIVLIKQAIDAGKLKDMKSALSKLKLAINDSYPGFTRDRAPFAAYVYAVNNKAKKAIASLHKAIIKKNYSYDGFPFEELLDSMSKSDMQIIFDDILSTKSLEWSIDYLELVERLYKDFPKEIEKFIIDGRLNMYLKGEARIEMCEKVIELGTAEASIGALNTYFGRSYIKNFNLNKDKLAALMNAVKTRSSAFQKEVMQEYFYKVAAKVIPMSMIQSDFETGILDDKMVTNYTNEMFNNYKVNFIVSLEELSNDELKMTIISSNDELMDYVTHNVPDLLPKDVQDVFLF